jgi:hypothetical protein
VPVLFGYAKLAGLPVENLLNSVVEVDNRPGTVGSIKVTMGGAYAAIDYRPRKLFFDSLLSGTNGVDGGGINHARRDNSPQNR